MWASPPTDGLVILNEVKNLYTDSSLTLRMTDWGKEGKWQHGWE